MWSGKPCLTAEPSVLPVSIPLRGLSPGTIADARESRSFQPSEVTGKSHHGYGHQRDNYKIGLSDSIGTTQEQTWKTRCRHRSRCWYAAPATPAFETVLESPGYTVPEDEERGYFRSSRGTTSTSGSDVARDTGCHFGDDSASYTDDAARLRTIRGTRPVREVSDKRIGQKVFVVESTEGSTLSAICQDAPDVGPDLTKGGTLRCVCGRIRTGAVASGAEQYAGMPVPHDIVRGPRQL